MKLEIFVCAILTLSAVVDSNQSDGAVNYADEESASASESQSESDGERVTSLYSKSLMTMLDLMNDTVDACEDFFQHACGNYETYETYSPTPPPYLTNLEDRMHFFYDHKHEFVTVAGENLQQLHSKCKQRGGDARAQWRRILREVDFLATHELLYRHFPLLHYQWENWIRAGGHTANGERQLSWVPLAAKLAAHGIPTLLHISFVDHTIFVAAPTDTIGAAADGRDGAWRCPSWQSITASLQPLLRGRNPQVALIISRELRQLCMELNDGWSGSNSTHTPLSTSTPQSQASDGTAGSGEERSFLLHDDVVQYLEIFFGTLNFSVADISAARKIPLNVPHLLHILRVVRQAQPRILFNYVLWRAYEQLRYADCFELTVEFETALLAEYWHWHVFQPQLSRDVTLALYLFHTARYYKQRRQQLHAVRSWESVLWRDRSPSEHQRRQQLARTRELEALIRRYANERLTVDAQVLSYNEAAGATAAQRAHNFYGHLVWLRRQKLRHSFRMPYVDADDPNEAAHILRQFLYFAITIIKRPLFHYFATTHFDLWHDASQFFYRSDDFYTAWHCMAASNADQPQLQLSQPEALAIYHFGRAFSATYVDYEFWFEAQTFSFAEDFFLHYFGMDRQRVLFYAVTQMYCGRNDAVYAARLNRSFQQLHAFRAAFNCSTDISCL